MVDRQGFEPWTLGLRVIHPVFWPVYNIRSHVAFCAFTSYVAHLTVASRYYRKQDFVTDFVTFFVTVCDRFCDCEDK